MVAGLERGDPPQPTSLQLVRVARADRLPGSTAASAGWRTTAADGPDLDTRFRDAEAALDALPPDALVALIADVLPRQAEWRQRQVVQHGWRWSKPFAIDLANRLRAGWHPPPGTRAPVPPASHPRPDDPAAALATAAAAAPTEGGPH